MQTPSIHEPSSTDSPTTGATGDEVANVTAAPTDLFPLAATPFERYMIVEDRPSFPMTFVVTCELDGRAEEAALRHAVQAALQRHPLLTARLVRQRGRTKWVSTTAEPAIVWRDGTPPAARVIPLDPWSSDGAGVPLEVIRDGERTTFHFHFHHAVTDGIGAFQYVGDVLALYGQQTATTVDRPRLLALDSEQLKQRHQFDIRVPHAVSRWVAWRAMLTESWRVFSRIPSVLRSPETPASDHSDDEHATQKIILDGTDLDNYNAVAASCDVTVNDLMLRDVFVAMRRWNAALGARSGRQWLRTTVPTSLRYRSALRTPATNMLGYAFVTHRAAECDDAAALLTSLSQEMKAVTQWGLGSFFVTSVGYADRVPGLLWLGSRLSRRFSTLVFSNLGDVVRRFRARFPTDGERIVLGNLVLRNLYGAPPVRPGTRLAIALMSYDRQVTFVVRYDRQVFTRAAAASFLEMFREQLLGTAASIRTAPQ